MIPECDVNQEILVYPLWDKYRGKNSGLSRELSGQMEGLQFTQG